MAEPQRDDLAHLTPVPPPDEWKECRTALGRLDVTLADLRKYSFSFATLLITASAFLGSKSDLLPPRAQAAVIIVLLVLTTALFLIDRYYSLIQSGVAERVLDLERQSPHRTEPQYLSEQISFIVAHSRAPYAAMFLYLALEGSLIGIGVAMLGRSEAYEGFQTYLQFLVKASGKSGPLEAVGWEALWFGLFYIGLTALMVWLLPTLLYAMTRHRWGKMAKLRLFLFSISVFPILARAALVFFFKLPAYAILQDALLLQLPFLGAALLSIVAFTWQRWWSAVDFSISLLFIVIDLLLISFFGLSSLSILVPVSVAFLLSAAIVGWQRWWSALDYPYTSQVSHLYYRLKPAGQPINFDALIRSDRLRPFAVQCQDSYVWAFCLRGDSLDVEPPWWQKVKNFVTSLRLRSDGGHWLGVVLLSYCVDPNVARQRLAPALQQWRYDNDALRQTVEFVPYGDRTEFSDLLEPKQILKVTSLLYALMGPLVFALYAASLGIQLGLQPPLDSHFPSAVLFWSAGICLGTVVSAFIVTEIQSGTGRFKNRDYFLTSTEAHHRARSMQIRARTTVRGIWAFSHYEGNEGLRQYFKSTLKATRQRDIRTIRIIDLANLPIQDIILHIQDTLTYLGPLYEIRFCANIDYEMLIIDNSEAVMFFRMDDPERRSWIHHTNSRDVAFVQNQFSALMTKSKCLPNVSHMNADKIRDWLQQTRDELLKDSKQKPAQVEPE